MVPPTTTDLKEVVDALEFHMEYDMGTKMCGMGDDWCSERFFQVPLPKGSPSILIVWPAYWGMRLWLGLWGFIPGLFGRRIGVSVVDGVPRTQLIKKKPE